MPLSLHGFGNLLAYVGGLVVSSVNKFTRDHGADAGTAELKSLGRRMECTTAKV